MENFTVTFRPSNEQAVSAPKVSPTAARDAAVAKAVADAPDGCPAAGRRNAVHVIAAYHEETEIALSRIHPVATARTAATTDMQRHVSTARGPVAAYERARRAGYGKEQAAERTRDGSVTALRLFAAYEAGR